MPHPALLRRLVVAGAAGLAVGFAFTAFFTSALHDPKPNGMRIAVVGPPDTAAQVQRQLSQAIPGGFDVVGFATAGDARDAVRDQNVTGPGRGERRDRASCHGRTPSRLTRARPPR